MTINPPRTSKSKILAEAVAQSIEDLFAVETVRKLAPADEFEKIRDRQIRVWPHNRTGEILTRALQSNEYEIAIAVIDRVPSEDDEDLLVDELLALVESFADNLLKRTFGPEGNQATAIRYQHAPLYDKELLETHRLFAAGVALTLTRHEATLAP